MQSLRHQTIRWIEASRARLRDSRWARYIPVRFITHYVIPLIGPGGKVPYDSQSYWDRWYAQASEFSDGITIDDTSYNPLFVRYHYNSTENSILQHFSRNPPPAQPAVLDIGSGAGHWIEFYRDVFRARQVTGLDTSRSCVAALQEQWADTNNVFVRQADISQPGLGLEEGPFDLISAIGVMFHIVNDQDWERALQTMARHLHPRGTIIVGGHFGWITQNVQFCGTKENPHAYVNKRVRSLSRWRRVAMKCGLTIVGLQRTRSFRGIRTPQNDILFLSLKT